jgi:hypothetical protein
MCRIAYLDHRREWDTSSIALIFMLGYLKLA